VIRDFFRFYGICLARAWRGKLFLALSVSGGIATVASLGVWVLSPPPSIERFVTVDLPGIAFMAVLAATLLLGFFLAPFQLHREGEQARAALQDRLRAKLEFSLPGTGVVNASTHGNTLEAVNGRRQTILQGVLPDVVCLQCKNIGEVPIHGVRARIMHVRRQSQDEAEAAAEILEPVELPWNKEDLAHSFVVDLAPNEVRRIWIGRVTDKGYFWVLRNVQSLPLDFQQVFGPPGRYLITLQADSADAPPVQALLEVNAAAGPEPKQNGLWRGIVSATLVDQGSPRLIGAE
jgi:hypothetical protein